MLKSALLGIGLIVAVATTAAAQPYYPYYYPGYANPPYSYPYGYTSYYGWPNYYWGPPYLAAPAYADPYVWWRPYSDSAGPAASGHTGY